MQSHEKTEISITQVPKIDVPVCENDNDLDEYKYQFHFFGLNESEELDELNNV